MCSVNIDDAKKYMFTEDNMISFLPNVREKNIIEKEPTKFKSVTNQLIKPKQTEQLIKPKQTEQLIKPKQTDQNIVLKNQQDPLFWCFYILLYGEQEYEMKNSFQTEKEFKINSIEKLRTIKPQLKALKLKINDTENELLNSKKITIKGLVALCLLYKKNLFYVWNRKYYEMINDANQPINVIHCVNNDYLYDVDDDKLEFYRENYWNVQNVDKPIKGMTGYSKEELLEIAEKLDIQDMKKKTKKEIYEKILEKV
jgi:hypothetical protein